MKTIWLALALLMPLGSADAACDPPGQFRIVSANLSPGIEKDSFEKKPKVLYRAGQGHLRLEEMPDAANGMHMLFVTRWPDVWVVNLMDKTGEHAVDDSKTVAVHAPALDAEPPEGMPKNWESLEFGCEWDFFVANKAVQSEHSSDKHPMTKHQITEGEWRVTLVTKPDSHEPWLLMLAKANNVIYAIRYLAYEHQDQPEPTLFAKPAGIKFTEPLK
jgi:hypothetical protein